MVHVSRTQLSQSQRGDQLSVRMIARERAEAAPVCDLAQQRGKRAPRAKLDGVRACEEQELALVRETTQEQHGGFLVVERRAEQSELVRRLAEGEYRREWCGPQYVDEQLWRQVDEGQPAAAAARTLA